MNDQHPPQALREQFRMARLQVFNWGTFTRLHDIPISERGFLIVGPSGAGKSTLLDAFSALLVPPRWVDFNAAAREADRTGRDRNLASYVRGAWSAQSDSTSGAAVTRYLRTGTTWSAIALTYRNANSRTVVLVQLFWVRGNGNANQDVKRLFLVLERPFDLREIDDFSTLNFDVRKLKAKLGDAYIRDEFRPYSERFSRLLGIESDMALRLLHKTQSAKNVGDLNAFLRDFMLDEPETFAVAARLVDEFGELNAAHLAVVTAREQVQTLAPARSRFEQMEALKLRRDELEELRAGMHSYRERLRMTLLAEHIAALRVEADGLAGRVQYHTGTLENRASKLRDLEQQRRDAGGDQIERLEDERKLQETHRHERLRKRQQAVDACKALGWVFVGTPEGFAELIGNARQEINDWNANGGVHDRLLELDRLRMDAAGKRDAAGREVASLRRQPSNIPAALLELRRRLAQAIGVSEQVLPFVGELVEVKPEEAPWRGAIERVLRGFALSVLVADEHYAALSVHVNETNLGQRLVYHRASRTDASSPRTLGSDSLVVKLNVGESHFAPWLQNELRKHFDYDCVDSLRAFRAAPDRAVTREGQVKHSRSRHEKDDRRGVDVRQNWVLGFENRDKLALYEQDEQAQTKLVSDLEAQIATLRRQLNELAVRMLSCQTLVNLQWQEVDALPPTERLSAIDRQLATIRAGNSSLKAIDEQLEQQRELVKQSQKEREDAIVAVRKTEDGIAQNEARLEELARDPGVVALTQHQQAGLDERFGLLQPIALKDVDAADRSVGKGLADEIGQLGNEIAQCDKYVETQFGIFIQRWKAESDGLDATLAAAQDFFSKLRRLETDGLPAHEQRFFDLLQNQSHQNLAALSSYLNDARKAILSRMEDVNDSLREVPFNQTPAGQTYLQIQPKDRQLPEVRQFKQDIAGVLSHAWNEDAEQAEARFVELRKLVQKLASQEPEQRRWREAVLDVRQHIDFVGKEFDEHDVEQDVHPSGAGKSGGQRQKLATTVLAAALRYQLGGSETGIPMYAAVVLDEAFDKADSEFTALAMNIFANFGFQMIVATPLKSVMTLEPFIGGACFVEIRDRRDSGVLLIEYDDSQQRLRLPDQARREAQIEAAG